MQWPRKGIVIRVLIYGPLLGYFGWQAWQRWRGDPEPEPETVEDKLAPHKKTITLPDGTKQEVYELTPQQAEEILGQPLPAGAPANDSGTPAKADEPSPPSDDRGGDEAPP